MLSATELWYRTKKLCSLYPGVVAPVSGSFLADHYAQRRKARGMFRGVIDLIAGLAFLAWIPARARAVQRRLGLDAAWRSRTIAIARAAFADPNDIALFRIDHASQLDGYIRRFEDAGLNKLINPLAWQPGCVLADKIAFYARCATNGLRHPRVVATFVDGQVEVLTPPAGRALLLKPSRGEGGAGVAFVEGAPEAPAEIAAWSSARFAGRRYAWLVQERIAPHPDLADLALSALPTVRLTTILDEYGRPEVVSAVLRMPSDPAAVVDNMKAGGLLSAVDDDGILGVACKGYGGGDYAVHPVTGATIPGRRLPDWPAACALVVAAHGTAFTEYALIGWDVGLSPDGPILIEGNGKPGVLMPQRAARRGLGDQRYGVLLAQQLSHVRH